MILTANLKSYLSAKFGVFEKASEDVFKAVLNSKLESKEITLDEVIENSKLSEQDRQSKLREALQKGLVTGAIDRSTLLEAVQEDDAQGGATMPETNETKSTDKITGKQVLGGPRVKSAGEQYSTTKSYAKHARTGAAVHYQGSPVERPSDLERAKMGAWLKWRAMQDRVPDVRMTDHDKQLLNEVFEDRWVGTIYQEDCSTMAPDKIKAALLGDTGSGGQYATPLYFDRELAITPLLSGEISPFVTIIEMDQGTTVQGAGIGNPSLHWDSASEGAAISLDDFSGYVGQMNSTVHRVTGAYEFGRNLLQDSPLALMQEVESQMMIQLGTSLDYVVANGDGTTQPQGIFGTSGLTTINSVNGAAGPLVVGDLESLMFGIPKQYRNGSMWRNAYVMNDNMYRRIRATPVGSDDARRVFGDDPSAYTILGNPVRINNSISQGYVAFGALASYRLYRRSGGEVRYTDQGMTLTLKNTCLLTIQGRYAGRPTIGSAFAVMTDGAVVDNG